MKIVIAIDGSGITNIEFLVGKLKTLNFTTGPNTPIRVQQATELTLTAGQCTHNQFSIEADPAVNDNFLTVKVTCDNNSSMNFFPDNYPGFHVNPGTTQILTYNRTNVCTAT